MVYNIIGEWKLSSLPYVSITALLTKLYWATTKCWKFTAVRPTKG